MGSHREYMEEVAQTHLDHNDPAGHKAIMDAIDDEHSARITHPDCVRSINNAIAYAKRESGGR